MVKINRIILTENGFTLIETLIALIITGILTISTFPTLLRLYDFYQLNQVVSTLQSDLHYIRDHNMGPYKSSERLSIRIYAFENRYTVSFDPHGQTHLPRQLHQNITIPLTYPLMILTFTSQGTVSQGFTLPIRSKYYSKELVFSIGTGGFDIRDSE